MRPCKHCEHPAADHLDRAVVACAPNTKPRIDQDRLKWNHGSKCPCPGYEANPC